MKLCFVCDEYPPAPHGAIGASTQTLARALAWRGHHVRVIGVYPRAACGAEEETDERIEVIRLREVVPHVGWIHARCQMFRTIARWCRHGEIDLLEVPDAGGWASGWGRLPVPLVVRLHGSRSWLATEQGQRPDEMMFRLEKETIRRADFCCASSRYVAEKARELFGYPTESEAVLYPGVEIPSTSDCTARRPGHVVVAGAQASPKALVSLLNAWPLVAARCPEAQLHIVSRDGTGADGGSAYESLLRRLDDEIRQRVRFHGAASRPQWRDMLQTAHVAVFMPHAELCTVSPVEALACGCPTIVTGNGSAKEWIRTGDDGLLADLDDPAEVAAAIVRVLSDAQLAERLGASGRHRAQEFLSLAGAVARNEEFYRRCVARFRRAVLPAPLLRDVGLGFGPPASVPQSH